ncbi:hypothetical protein JYU34_000544 [Plutella xylostella]|uniref:Uncharacterized protein n=1 Tax=Plutella xylostella TaxID=51655 RepID=A0ABQ7R7Z5_PLUXY|nr:hypothetical protein JYU34_000544 [Plutella xylostella]
MRRGVRACGAGRGWNGVGAPPGMRRAAAAAAAAACRSSVEAAPRPHASLPGPAHTAPHSRCPLSRSEMPCRNEASE